MNPRQVSLSKFVREVLDARAGEPKYKKTYDDEVPSTLEVPSLFIPPLQYIPSTGTSSHVKRQVLCTLVLYRETRKKAHWDATVVLDAIHTRGGNIPYYEGTTKTNESFYTADVNVRAIDGGPTNVKAATVTVQWDEWIPIHRPDVPKIMNVDNEAFYRAEDVASSLSYDVSSQSNEVKSPMLGQTRAGEDSL